MTGREEAKRFAIVGTREPSPKQTVDVIALVSSLPRCSVIVSGGARGVDSIAAEAAIRFGHSVRVWLPDWKLLGRVAGFARNQTIVDDADEVHAFPGKGGGTWDTIRKARKSGKTVKVYE